MIRLLRFLKPYTLPVVAVLILVFFQTQADLYLPTLMSDIINDGVMKGNTDYIWSTGGWMLLIASAGAVLSLIAGFFSSTSAMGFGRDIRNKVFRKVEGFSLHEFDKIGTATLITRTTNDITQIQMVVIMILRMMIMAPMLMIGGIIRALQEDRQLTWVLVVAMPLLIGLIAFIGSKGFPLFKLMQVKIDKINLVLRERLSGIRVIRAFNRADHETVRFDKANRDLTDNAIKVNHIMAFLMPALMLIMNLTQLAILWFGIIRIDDGNMQIGSLMAFSQYAMQILFSMLMLSMLFIMIPRASAAAARVNEILDTNPGIKDPDTALACSRERGHVAFDNVSFRYHGAEQPAISGISFSADPGEVTAIIGSTGSGKTTLINLIPRFYDVEEGTVLIDGQDVRTMSQECLREKIGFVSQQAVLFSGTIAENIRFGKNDATEEEMRHAADVAQALDFIEAMDGQFNHDISQGGTNVSGGQKQRLSIARALVRKPEIYVFDDSFSALDFKTDAKLRAALKNEISDATVLIVAQRVGTVMDADRIIVLNEGKVVGIGKHKDLLTECPVYREIVVSQLSEEEIA